MFGFIVWLFTTLRSWVRRIYTIVRAFLTLYTMPQKMIDDFMESYTLFDEDSVNPDNSHKIQNYYAVLNHLCSLGEVEKMYIPPLMDNNASIMQNQTLYEQKMMRDMDLKPGMHVLDVGCGRGRVAAHVALHSGAQVTGINIEKTQVANGNDNAKILGISDRLKIRHHDFNQLPLDFKDETFDAVYEVQAFSYIKDGNFDPLFKELFRVMKPGAKLSFLEWVSLPKFDPKNKEHQKLLKQVKPLLGAVFTPTVDDMTGSLERAGFKVILSKIPSIDGFQYPLVMRAAKYFIAMGYIVKLLCFLRILPKYFGTLMDRFNKDGDILAKGDEMRLWTTTYQIVAQKPKSS